MQCAQYQKDVHHQGCVYLEYTNFENRTIHGGLKVLKHMKVENKTIHQYKNPNDEDNYCVVTIFMKHIGFAQLCSYFYYRPLPDDGSGVPSVLEGTN